MNAKQFLYLEGGRLANKGFFIKDSVHLEYSGGMLYSESIIRWKGCFEYVLYIKRTYFDGAGLKEGDTLSVKILEVRKDTLMCIASASGHSFPVNFLKSKMQQ